VNLLAVNAVDVPGEPEIRLLDAARRLRDDGWEITVSSPAEGPIADAGFPWVHLDVGGLGAGEGARAVASWPRALRLAQRFDVVYLNSTVCGRLLPALRGTHSVSTSTSWSTGSRATGTRRTWCSPTARTSPSASTA
jgi:hypothetical protein